jgi:hypothetical protein
MGGSPWRERDASSIPFGRLACLDDHLVEDEIAAGREIERCWRRRTLRRPGPTRAITTITTMDVVAAFREIVARTHGGRWSVRERTLAAFRRRRGEREGYR